MSAFTRQRESGENADFSLHRVANVPTSVIQIQLQTYLDPDCA